MIRSTVNVSDHTAGLRAEIRRRTITGLNAAARVGETVAERQAAGLGELGEFKAVPAQPTHQGFVSGINGGNKKFRIFDKGSLGKRRVPLGPRSRRKDTWPVDRKGSEFTAHRRDITGKGVAPRNITNPARTAGRKALIRVLRGG